MNWIGKGLTIPVVATTQTPSVRTAIPCILQASPSALDQVAIKVYIVSAAELVGNGGQYELEAREVALNVYEVTGVETQDGTPVPIYLVG